MAIYIRRLFFTEYEVSFILWPRGTFNTKFASVKSIEHGEYVLRVLNLEFILSKNIYYK